MSPEAKLRSRFPHRVLVIGDYDWGSDDKNRDFEILNREIRGLGDVSQYETEGQQITGRRILEEEGESFDGIKTEDREVIDDSPEDDATLVCVFNARGASAMAKGVANAPQGLPDGWINGIPFYKRPYTLPCLEIEVEWLWKKGEINPYQVFPVLRDLRPTKILNFDRSTKSPAHRTLTKHVVEYAKQFNTLVSTIQR